MKFPTTWVQTVYESPLGLMRLAASTQGLAGVWFEGQKHQPQPIPWITQADHPVLEQTVSALERYFKDGTAQFDVPLDLSIGTPFQRQIWQALCGIPCGQTTSYGALALSIGRPQSVRALAAAVGHNPVSILVPCHRVIGAQGDLVGYAGGLHRKAALLQLEGALSGALI